MKYSFFLFFLVSGFSAFSQDNTQFAPPVVNTHTYGYIDGVRLDSVQAEYAGFRSRGDKLIFDYGQPGPARAQFVKDSTGRLLTFTRSNITFLLNFLYFNGWQLDESTDTLDPTLYILRKRHRK
jgi:hypothetical protein